MTSAMVLVLGTSLSFLANGILKSMAFPAFLSTINVLSLSFVLSCAFLFSLLAGILPLRRVSDLRIQRELVGED